MKILNLAIMALLAIMVLPLWPASSQAEMSSTSPDVQELSLIHI